MTTPIFARGVAKTLTIAPELVGFGTQGAGPGQALRRTTADLNLNIQQFDSQEILPSQQMRDSRHGPYQTQGTLSGQLSPGSYAMLFEGLLRGTFAPNTFTASIADTAGTIDANANFVLVSPTAAWTSGSLRLGDVVRLTQGVSVGNYRVIALNPTLLGLTPIGFVPTTFAVGTQVSVAVPGKKLIVPPGPQQIDRSFTLEEWYADIGRSNLYLGTKVSQIALNIPVSGFVTFQASFTGQNMVESNAQVYANPTPVTSSSSLTAVSGKVIYQAAPILYITGMNLQLSTQAQAAQVVGNNQTPAIFVSQIMARGSFTALYTGDTLMSDFLNEAEVSLSVTMTASPAANADFVTIFLPRVKLSSNTKTDSQSAITRSFNFTALEYVTASSIFDLTTVTIQDSSLT